MAGERMRIKANVQPWSGQVGDCVTVASLRHVTFRGFGQDHFCGMVLASLLAAAALLLTASLALAAAPEKPEKEEAITITATTATLVGVLNPNATGEAGEYQFSYRLSESECEGESVAPEPAGMSIGFKEEAESVNVTGLQPSAKYMFCLLTRNGMGETAVGSPVTFTTLAAPPAVDGESVSARRATSTTLEAQVNPNNEETIYSFEYATNEALTGATKIEGSSPLLGFGDQAASVSTGEILTPNTTYYYRVIAKNVASEETVGTIEHFTTALPPETPEAEPATAVDANTATLHGVLNPNNPGEAGSYEFLYKQSATECEAGKSAPAPAAASLGQEKETVSTPVTELLPHTQYAFCLRATNAAEESAVSAPVQTFTTPVAPPKIEEASTSDVAATSATFSAKINPEGASTSYTFEYAPEGGAFISVPEAAGKGSITEGTTGVTVSVHVQQGLLAHTVYQLRVSATNSLTSATSEPLSFATQPAGSTTALADGRQWELVSPPIKNGAAVLSPAEPVPLQAAVDGGGIVYATNAPIEPEPQGYSARPQVLSIRGGHGWSSRDIAIPHGAVSRIPVAPEYQFFSEDLSSGLAFWTGSDTTLLSAQASEQTPYVRRESLCDIPATVSECYLPVLTGKEGFANVPPGTVFGRLNTIEFEGAAPDLRHILLDSRIPLTETTPAASNGGLYEWSGGRLALVSVLPQSEGGAPAPESNRAIGPSLEDAWSADRHSISNDGSRLFWETKEEQGAVRLYIRDTARGESVRLDVQQLGAPVGGVSQPMFQIASPDGSKVFFTDSQPLTAQSGGGDYGDLYECAIIEEAGKLACDLTDLTPESGGHRAEVRNIVAGASEDGSYVYFVANGVLPGSGATQLGTCTTIELGPNPGATCNLYVSHNGTTTFIAALSQEDENDWGNESRAFHNVGFLTARVSPNGRYFAFMSDRSLTSYDNRDAVSGKPDQEVYLYDATSGRLACVSCNPTGSPPTGVEVGQATGNGGNLVDIMNGKKSSTYGLESWVAANIPPGELLRDTSLYQSRALSDGGRLFFNSNDALVSGDVNETEDVYEFEPKAYKRDGKVDCTASSETFSVVSDGCVSLISSGSSPEESGFLDASTNGGDVFFVTTSRLASQDGDTALDVYDAHECSAAVPCVSQPVSSPPCDTGDACKAAPSPQPPIFGAPSSATFTGPGNVVRGGASSKPAVKVLTRTQKLARALQRCSKQPKRKRKACVRQARKRFGAKTARKTVRTIGKGQG